MNPSTLTIKRTLNWTVFSLSASYLLFRYRIRPIVERIRENYIFDTPFIPNALLCLGLILCVVGYDSGASALKANTATYKHAVSLVAAANKNDKNAAPIVSTNPAAVPATVQPSADTLASYTVAPNMPRYLIIPKLNVNARILSVGVTSSGALETPGNVFDTAWYNQSSLPGQPGAMLIDGHISSWTAHGVFYGLNTLVAGDAIEVVRGDGTTFTYDVVSSQVYSASNVDMSAAVTPINPGAPGLNLISCTGDVISGTSEFNERIVVFASLQS